MMFFETTYNETDDLGFISAAAVGTGAAGGPVALAIMGGIAAVQAIIAIFRAHKAKVQREDQISGAWAASGPQAIQDVVSSWRGCLISGSEAIAALKEIASQFREMTASIVKTGGKWGVFPDPNQPRPSSECNWACGTYYELHSHINDLIAEIQSTNPCESAADRAARKCANPAFVAANPTACTTGKFSQAAIASSVASSSSGASVNPLMIGLLVAAFMVLS